MADSTRFEDWFNSSKNHFEEQKYYLPEVMLMFTKL